MAAIKALELSAEKWVRKASVSAPDLVAGVQAPRRPWGQSAIDANQNYVTSVVAAANAGRFPSGIRRAGEAKWQTNTATKALTRYPEGVGLAGPAWATGYAPFQQGYAATTLGKRGVRGSTQNSQISTSVQQLFNQIRVRRAGGAGAAA